MPIDYSKFNNIEDSDEEEEKKKQRKEKDKDIKGQLVEAHGLKGAAQLNGLIGTVVNRQGERVGVDFGPPHGSKALKPDNLRSVSPGTAERRTKERMEKEERERRADEERRGRSRESRRREEEEAQKDASDGDDDVGTWYKHREWKPKQDSAAPAAAPVKVAQAAPAPVPAPAVAAGGSAWNTAGTWEEKDVLPWAQGRIGELAGGLSHDFGQGVVRVTAVEVKGDASVGVIRGKKRYLFDLTVEAKWAAELPGTGAAGTDGARKANGVVTLSDVAADEEPPYRMEYELKDGLSASAAARQQVRDAVGPLPDAVQRGECLCAKLHAAIAEWKAEYHKM